MALVIRTLVMGHILRDRERRTRKTKALPLWPEGLGIGACLALGCASTPPAGPQAVGPAHSRREGVELREHRVLFNRHYSRALVVRAPEVVQNRRSPWITIS